jgi:tripartite-type tricarboxylate transporter receptor subunit TctC
MLGVVSGQVDVLITAGPTALPQVRGGKVRALMVTSPQRLPALPDVPTTTEIGLKTFNATNWFAVAAPKGTPTAIIEKLNTALNEVVQDPEVAARYTQLAMVVRPNSVAEADSFLRSETEKWGRVIREANIKLE